MFVIWRSLRLVSRRNELKSHFRRNFGATSLLRCTEKSEKAQDGGPEADSEKKSRDFHENYQKNMIVRGSFEAITNKNRETYLDMIHVFENKDKHRRNHVEFIYAALKNMEHFGVHKDLTVYKALINVMPKGKFIPTNYVQVEFQHYPKQQQCMIDLLEQMEDNGVMPDYEMEDMLINIFGRKGFPVRKFWRMMYWMPKFKNASPWLLPNPMPDDILEIARMAVEQMCTVDNNSKVVIYQTKDVEESIDDTWIVSGQSPDQKMLLQKHDVTSALHIEGPFMIWLRDKNVNYYVLKGDPPPPEPEEDVDLDDVKNIKVDFFGMQSEVPKTPSTITRSVHEQKDGTIYAICATGTSTKDSLLSWIRLLERDGNAILSQIPVLFKFRTPEGSPLVVQEKTPEKS
ncbi:evolutionarily conserved signaling intermediate in Toll pathway, mitochondrial [Culicoides brevitarsis]|uniref:evolutionarily conserved signaling intermediate in Toll pathway, mitochondrial n=1 Tax=Culicoides brevitarsis TaxID=469753 RepID=UPI00307B4DFF